MAGRKKRKDFRQCTAKAKSTGKRCTMGAEAGYDVCRLHGAGGGRPIEHGGYSTRLPMKLRKVFEEILEDPNLKSLNADIALNKTFLIESIGNVEAAFVSLEDPIEELRAAVAEKDAEKVRLAARDLLAAFDSGSVEWGRIAVMFRHMDRRERLLKTDALQQRLSREGLSPSEAGVFVAMVTDSLIQAFQRHKVKDGPAILSEISRDIDAAFGSRGGASPRRAEGN